MQQVKCDQILRRCQCHYRFIQRSYSASHNACENVNCSSSSHEFGCLCLAIFSRSYSHHIVFFSSYSYPPPSVRSRGGLVSCGSARRRRDSTKNNASPRCPLTFLRPFLSYNYFLAITQILWATDDQKDLNYIFKTFSWHLLFSFAQPLSSCALWALKLDWVLGEVRDATKHNASRTREFTNKRPLTFAVISRQ